MIDCRVILFCFLFLLPTSLVAGITVSVSPEPVVAGEEFEITFVADRSMIIRPDFSALNNVFEIVSQSRSSEMRYINQKVEQKTIWRLVLFAASSGTFTIPEIQFSQFNSPSKTIVVAQGVGGNQSNQAGKQDKQQGVYVELSIDQTEPMVQQEFILTQRLLHSVPMAGTQATMTHPEVVEGLAILKQLGNGKPIRKQEIIDGVKFEILERRYAVFAQSSGILTFGKSTFQGRLQHRPGTTNRSNNLLDPFGFAGKLIRRYSEPVSVAIREKAHDATPWLPARSVTLNAHWQTPPQKAKAGQPNTLTIAVMAEGLLAEQLPALELDLPDGVKAYPNQPQLSNDTTGQHVVGISQQEWVIMPAKAGEYTIPTMQVPWWNLEKGQAETATLDAITLFVAEGSGAMDASTTPPLTRAEVTALAKQSAAEQSIDKQAEAPAQEKQTLLDTWLGRALLALVVLIMLAAMVLIVPVLLSWRKKGAQQQQKDGSGVLGQADLWHAVVAACKNNDSSASYQAILRWVHDGLGLSPPMSQLRIRASSELKASLDDLAQALYSSDSQQSWQGERLLTQMMEFRQKMQQTSQKPQSGLAELYPNMN